MGKKRRKQQLTPDPPPAPPPEPVMPFGRYRGRRLSEVPRNMLVHYANWPEIWPDTREHILAEITRRGLPFGRWKGVPLDQVPVGYFIWIIEHFAEPGLMPPYDALVANLIPGGELRHTA